MKTPVASKLNPGLVRDLRMFRELCEQVLDLTSRECQALSDQNGYSPTEFNQKRKNLLPELESALINLRNQGRGRRPTTHSEETMEVFQAIQCVLMRILLMDRENQQALLRRGLVPPQYMPPVAASQPNYVAGLYRQNARVSGGVSDEILECTE
jgi:hypothetical protein